MQTEVIVGWDDERSLCVIGSLVGSEGEPMVIDKFDWGVSIVNGDPVHERVPATVTLVPSHISYDLGWEVVGCSEGC